MNITVDLDDVEALVQQAALSRQIMQLSFAVNEDAAVRRTRERVVPALDRLNRAVNDARHVKNPEEDEPLSPRAARLLKQISRERYVGELGGYYWGMQDADSDKLIGDALNELRVKKCVQICNLAIVAMWKDGERRATDYRILVRFTAKGQCILESAQKDKLAIGGTDGASEGSLLE